MLDRTDQKWSLQSTDNVQKRKWGRAPGKHLWAVHQSRPTKRGHGKTSECLVKCKMYDGHLIINYIYKAPFHNICHSALQLLTTFTPNTAHTSATDAESSIYSLLITHTHTHTHTLSLSLSKQCHVSFECWSEGLTEKSWQKSWWLLEVLSRKLEQYKSIHNTT